MLFLTLVSLLRLSSRSLCIATTTAATIIIIIRITLFCGIIHWHYSLIDAVAAAAAVVAIVAIALASFGTIGGGAV